MFYAIYNIKKPNLVGVIIMSNIIVSSQNKTLMFIPNLFYIMLLMLNNNFPLNVIMGWIERPG